MIFFGDFFKNYKNDMNEVFVCVWFFETQPSARHIINMKIKKMKKRERKEAQKLVSLNKISEKKNKRKKM